MNNRINKTEVDQALFGDFISKINNQITRLDSNLPQLKLYNFQQMFRFKYHSNQKSEVFTQSPKRTNSRLKKIQNYHNQSYSIRTEKINSKKKYREQLSVPIQPVDLMITPSPLMNYNKQSALLPKDMLMYGEDRKYYFHVGPGNNSELVRKIVQLRSNWFDAPSKSTWAHLKWNQSSANFDYSQSSIMNHFQFHKELTTKTGLLRNIKKYCSMHMINAFTIIPLSFQLKLQGTEWEDELEEFIENYESNAPPLLQSKLNKQVHLQCGLIKQAHNPLKQLSRRRVLKVPQVFTTANTYLWLLKPDDMNRGNGVHVFQGLEELEGYLNKFVSSPNSDIKAIRCRKFVIQKYLECPLLIEQRKFDIRIWVLVTQKMKWYIFPEGYIRTSSENFTLDNQNQYIHLTNNAIQRNSQNYNLYEEGNQMSFYQYQAYLKLNHPDLNFNEKILPQIKEIVTITRSAIGHKINRSKQNSVFEIYGYDFMIDRNYKVWLIEVNTNPCIEETSSLLKTLVPRMLDDAFKLTIDQIFELQAHDTFFNVNNYRNNENMWKPLD